MEFVTILSFIWNIGTELGTISLKLFFTGLILGSVWYIVFRFIESDLDD